MVIGQDLELCNFENVDTTRFYFIFQGSPENHSNTLNNLKNTYPAAAFVEPIIKHYTWIHILIRNNLQ